MSEPLGPTLARLAAHWAKQGGIPLAVLDDTRQALAGIEPADLPELANLAEILLARVRTPEARRPARDALFTLLDAVRRRSFTRSLHAGQVDPWVRLLVPIIDRADYTFGDVLRSREETDPKTVAIRVLGPEAAELSVAEVARRTRGIARGLLSLCSSEADARVAILSENSVESALCDLACLSNGILDFPLPANATADQIVFMLRHSGARMLLVSDEEQLAKVLPSLGALPELREVIALSRGAADRHGLLSLDQLVGQGADYDDGFREARASSVKSRDLATVMYTSGTTGKPKGIQFSHLNLVSKRLCRGFALPELGEGDVFLSYLPLYHTFGRWLELAGSLWWGATYVLARSTATPSLVNDFKDVKPTVFISVPKKWFELQEAAVREAGTEDPDETAGHLRAITGGRLRYGLSAAGYLDPIVFRAFHRAGVELCSGYGMTEATGGITMTPPGGYVTDSIGKPLPGIDCRRADDGELLIRGPYVSPGYHHAEPEEVAIDDEGWFHTGDLVAIDAEGHYRITGRKKEIYKNRMGQTIAPQRVENLFRDFEAVSQAFLVGDHREYNTLLVWPNYEAVPALREKSAGQLREFLSSLVASANRFLAPFERVVAFQVLPRALDEAHGELTHKATFKREVVERNWKDLVERMYEQKALAFAADGMYLRIPNWVLREMGVLQHEVALKDGVLAAGGRTMRVATAPEAPGSLRLGDLAYATGGAILDLGALLARPALWLGNEALKAFLDEEAFLALVARRRKGGGDLRLDARLWLPPPPTRLPELLEAIDRDDVTFHSIHAAGELLRAERPEARKAIAHLQRGISRGQGDHAALCRALLRRAAEAPDEEVRRLAFKVLLPLEEPAHLLETLEAFLECLGPVALRDEDLASLGERGLSDPQVKVLLGSLQSDESFAAPLLGSQRRLLIGAMRLVTAHAMAHPTWYAVTRVPLARLTLHDDPELAARAGEEQDRMRRGFQNWIGPNLRLAIDPDSGAEYGWKEVVQFDPSVPARAREVLLQAISDTTLVRGSVFLFSRGVLLSLADLTPGGATVTHLGTQNGKSVYRLSLSTRSREIFDVAINVAESLSPFELREEIRWLLACGAAPPLVEDFGGYYPEYGIFTEEFIPGEDVARQVARFEKTGDLRRLQLHWPFLAWSALSALVSFWDRSGRKIALREPSPGAFIVPAHDYQIGARLVSISDRADCRSMDDLLDRFVAAFVAPVAERRPELAAEVGDRLLLSAVVGALGVERARPVLEGARDGKRGAAIQAFLAELKERGFTPKRVHFAARRYQRWIEVNPAATTEAKGTMLAELWGTYRLAELEPAYHDTRIRFFRQTVFSGARPEFGAAIDALMARARTAPRGGFPLEEQVAAIRGGARPSPEEDYFLARMTYRYLGPSDDAALISLPTGERQTTEVVLGVYDEEGSRFWIRGPVSPREVARLLQLFHEAHLQVTFGGEHEFLLALDAKETVIGGLFWRHVSSGRAHMEKVVVTRKHRGKGVSDGLMREFVRRLRARGIGLLETGYFQPEYLRRYGFRTDPTSGGLVLDLGSETPFRF
jgi:long-subunit acyl-CoA synthetase (AMP-forming)